MEKRRPISEQSLEDRTDLTKEERVVLEAVERELDEDAALEGGFTKTDVREETRHAERYAPKGSQTAFAARAAVNKGFARRPKDSCPKIIIVDNTKKR